MCACVCICVAVIIESNLKVLMKGSLPPCAGVNLNFPALLKVFPLLTCSFIKSNIL